MAYNRAPDRYQQMQGQRGPQAYAGDYGYNPDQYNHQAGYQDRGGQRYDGYPQDTYDTNQQYYQNYDDSWQHEQGGPQYQPGMNGCAPVPEAQPRSYQYDDRYRQNGRQATGNDGRTGPVSGRRSPQSRPGTSASSRRTKRKSGFREVG